MSASRAGAAADAFAGSLAPAGGTAAGSNVRAASSAGTSNARRFVMVVSSFPYFSILVIFEPWMPSPAIRPFCPQMKAYDILR